MLALLTQTCLIQGVEALVKAEKKHAQVTGIYVKLLGLPSVYVAAAKKRLAQSKGV
jgi:hypothetical protein